MGTDHLHCEWATSAVLKWVLLFNGRKCYFNGLSLEVCIQGSHRLDKNFFLIISRFSMTVSLLDFVFATFCGKRRKMKIFYIVVKFLIGGTKHTNVIQFRGKIGKLNY